MNRYTPRRASKTRWLKNAPEYILDCFRQPKDNGGDFDVLFTGKLLGTINGEPQDFSHVYIMGLDVTADGRYCSFELNAYQAAQFRYANGKRRITWNDLPTEAKKAVKRWAETDY